MPNFMGAKFRVWRVKFKVECAGTRAKGEEGSMGNPTTKAVNKRYAVQGPKDNPDPHIARQAALRRRR